MFVHIYGIDHTKGMNVDKETGEVREYNKLNIHALEPVVNKDWKLQDGSSGTREGFGQLPIKNLSCLFERYMMVFGVKEFNDLMHFVDQDCEIQFDRYGRVDQVKLR